MNTEPNDWDDELDDAEEVDPSGGIDSVTYAGEAADEGWLDAINDQIGAVMDYDPYGPIDAMNDAQAYAANALDEVVPDGPFAWASKKWDAYIEKVEDNAPGIAMASAAIGVTSAAAATVVGAGALGLGAYTMYLLAYSPNMRRAIVAMDPASIVKAGNPFRGR